MMKKTLLVAFAASFLWSCSSDPPKDEGKAGVEDRTPAKPGADGAISQPVVKPPAVTTVITKPEAKPGPGPLNDPNNILSKRSIFYDYDSDAIKEEYRPLMQAHARYLADNSNARMLIQGNTDERGGREYNLGLGQRRAEAVRRMLVLMGAREGQIEAVSLGEEKPRCEEKTDSCYGQNRRSDILHSGEF